MDTMLTKSVLKSEVQKNTKQSCIITPKGK